MGLTIFYIDIKSVRSNPTEHVLIFICLLTTTFSNAPRRQKISATRHSTIFPGRERKSLIPPSMHRIERWRGFCLESLSAIPCQLWCPVMSCWVASRDLSKVLLWTPIIAKLAHRFPSSALGPLYKRNSRHQKASLVIMKTGLKCSLIWFKSGNSNDHTLRINEKW